jgi:prophage DNA circulation protein
MRDYWPLLVAFLGMPVWGTLLAYAYRRWAKREDGAVTFQKVAIDTTLKLLAERERDNLTLRQELRDLETARREDEVVAARRLAESETRARAALEAKARAERELDAFRLEAAEALHDAKRRRLEAETDAKRLRALIELGGPPEPPPPAATPPTKAPTKPTDGR